jgi:hypothetical protein
MSAIPQAIMAMGAGFGSEVAKGTGNKELSEAMRYEPTSKFANDILAGLEQAPKTITGSHMGFGPMPETWVTGLGTVSPNDIRVLAKQNIERAREAARIREDFVNAQSGIRRESALGGNTYGAALQRAADDLADFQARNQARRSEYATPMSGSVEVFGNLVPDTAMYAVRPNKSGSQVIREVPTPLNPAYSVSGESRLSEDLADIVYQQGPRTQDDKSYQHLEQFTNYVPGDFNKSARDMFHDFVQPALASEFPGTDPSDYGRAVHAKYGVNANEWYKKQLEAFALTPEAAIHNEKAFKVAMSDPEIPKPFEFLRDVLIIPPSAQFEGKKAADDWVMNNLQNYLVEHLGTPGDPIPRLIAETGRVPIEEGRDRLLTHNQRIDDQVKDLRAKAGMPTAGTFEPELDRTRNLLGQNNMVIQMLQDKENELIAAHPGVRPQDIPGWKEARKEVVQATKRKDETAKKFDNLMMAQSFENYSDLELSIADEKRFTENLEPYFKERFPMIPTNKDIAFQMRVPGPYRELAKDIQNRLAVSGAPGISGIEGAKNLIKAADIGSHTVPKAVQIKAELMAQREKMGEQAAKLADQKLMTHTKARMEAMPQDGTYGPATVVRITKDLGPEQIKSDISDITEWMDHCIGRGGSSDKKILSPKAKALGASNVPENQRYRSYIPAVASHLGNKVPAGSSGSTNQYMKDVIKGEADIVDFRDTATGVPFASLKLVVSRTHPGMYQFDEFYGYRDKEVTGPWAPSRNTDYTAEENNAYRQAIADWANDHQAQLKPATSDYLITYSKVYDTASNDHKSKLTNAFNAKKDEVNEVLYQMDKRFVSYPEFKQALDNFKANPPETIESLRGARDELSDLLREAEDPEATMSINQMDDLRHQITVLDQRIAAMENRPPVGARAVAQATQVQPDWNRQINQVREDTLNQLDEIDRYSLAAAIDETQNRFAFSQQPHEFVTELERRADYYAGRNQPELADAIRNVAMGYDSQIINDPVPAIAQGEDLDTQLFGITNRIRENYDDTAANVVDFMVASVTNDVGSINDNPRQWIDTLRQDSLNYRQEPRQALDDAINQLETAYAAQTQVPAAQVPANTGQRFDVIADVISSTTDRRVSAELQTLARQHDINDDAFGTALQGRIDDQVPGSPTRDELIDALQLWTNAQNAVIPQTDAYNRVRAAINNLAELENGAGIEAMTAIADGIMGNMNGPYADLTGPQRVQIRQQLNDTIDRIRSTQEPEPLEGIVQMDMNRIRDNYDQEVYNEVDGTLTAIHDNYDINEDPALFIERVRQNADRALRSNDTTMHSIYENLASILTRTLRENNAITDARRRIQNEQAVEQARDLINAPISDTELQTVERSLRDPLSTAMASPPQIFDAYNAVIQDIGRTDTPEDALQHLSVVRSILLDPETDLQADFSIDGPEDRQLLDALITRHGDAIRELVERDQGLVMDDDQLDDIASDYLNNLDNPTPESIRNEAGDMRNGMTDLPEFRELTNERRINAQNEIAMRMEQHADMMEDMEEPPNQAPPALPAPEAQRTPEQNAINEALRHPRFWYNRYPDLPHDVVTGMIHRLNIQHAPPDFAGMRDYAAQGMRRTIFENLNPVQQRQAAAMIDDIANDYQNRIQRIDNQQQQQYNTVVNAYLGILDANNQFAGQEGLDTLRALPQLLRRQNLRQEFGIANLSVDERNNLITDFEELYESRTRNPQLPPPGHKRGGYIKKKLMKNEGGKVEPSSPSSSVNDHSKPVMPIKKIHNPDAPEFKDILIRERAIRGGGGSGGSGGADLKQIMNPRAYASGGLASSSIDEALQQPGLKHKFTGEDILKNYGDSVFESYDKSKARKRLEPVVLKQIMSTTDSYDDGQHLMNRQSMPLGKADSPAAPTGQSFEDFQRQHMHRLRPEEVSRRGNTGIKNGGAVDIDQMRYELMRKQ